MSKFIRSARKPLVLLTLAATLLFGLTVVLFSGSRKVPGYLQFVGWTNRPAGAHVVIRVTNVSRSTLYMNSHCVLPQGDGVLDRALFFATGNVPSIRLEPSDGLTIHVPFPGRADDTFPLRLGVVTPQTVLQEIADGLSELLAVVNIQSSRLDELANNRRELECMIPPPGFKLETAK